MFGNRELEERVKQLEDTVLKLQRSVMRIDEEQDMYVPQHWDKMGNTSPVYYASGFPNPPRMRMLSVVQELVERAGLIYEPATTVPAKLVLGAPKVYT